MIRAATAALVCALFAVSATATSQTKFDFYVLATSWQPEFCHGQSYPGCSTPQSFWKSHLTLHGLWPNNNDGTYPSTCTSEKFNMDDAKAVGLDTMMQYWPNVKNAVGTSQYGSFWAHEWTKHGTCTGMNQTVFYETAVNLLKKVGTPSAISDNVGSTSTSAKIQEGYGSQKVAVGCNGGSYMNGVNLCFAKDQNNVPTTQIDCPSSVSGSCTDPVKIPSF